MFYDKGYPVKTIGEVIDKKIARVGKVFEKTSPIQYLDISSIDNSSKTVTGLTPYVLAEAPSRAQYVLKQNDIMYSTVRPNLQNIAINPYSDDNVVGSTGFCVLRCIGVTTGYMWGVINSIPFTEAMVNQASGANYPAVTDKVVHAYEIPIPPESEQNAYEELVRQSDKSKFVRFKSQFIEMFGDPTENPNGWTKLNVKEAVKQGYIARPLDGNHGEKHPKGDDYVPEGVPFLMAQDLKDKRVDFTSCHFITEEQASTLKKGWAKEGDVLLTHKGTIGRVAIVQPSQYENMLLTPQITYYRCLKDIDNEYLAAYFMTGFFVEQLERLITGTTRACVTITQQEQLELIIPPVPMQREFVKFVNQSDKSK